MNMKNKMLRRPITMIKRICYRINNFYTYKIWFPVKWFFQRGMKGYCDKDTWDFERWFFDVAPKIIRDIEKHHSGVFLNGIHQAPVSFNKEFLEMADCFEKANSLDCFFTNEPEYPIYLKYKNRGFELFNKYFDYLGW